MKRHNPRKKRAPLEPIGTNALDYLNAFKAKYLTEEHRQAVQWSPRIMREGNHAVISLGHRESAAISHSIQNNLGPPRQVPAKKPLIEANPFHGEWGQIAGAKLIPNQKFIEENKGFFARGIKEYFRGFPEPAWIKQQALGEEIMFTLVRHLMHSKIPPERTGITNMNLIAKTIKMNESPEAIVHNLTLLFKNLQNVKESGIQTEMVTRVIIDSPQYLPVFLKNWDEISRELKKAPPSGKRLKMLFDHYLMARQVEH